MNDWYFNYFSVDVKIFSFGMLGFLSCMKFVVIVDFVIVEYIFINVYKYGKVSVFWSDGRGGIWMN